ncbi:unnamed protein product [Zymoseptoria tritici ST99CH_1E4]|uniref:Uncharacterized protein n=1 Tax=Zymoseptoria tritici ST99CH_1E4 TaxID=1276532 RepID=A0A2H1GKX1_ZYMTR|nr:unnamed protein product [Zymoseptoria tritici ST99CH_1E4]
MPLTPTEFDSIPRGGHPDPTHAEKTRSCQRVGGYTQNWSKLAANINGTNGEVSHLKTFTRRKLRTIPPGRIESGDEPLRKKGKTINQVETWITYAQPNVVLQRWQYDPTSKLNHHDVFEPIEVALMLEFPEFFALPDTPADYHERVIVNRHAGNEMMAHMGFPEPLTINDPSFMQKLIIAKDFVRLVVEDMQITPSLHTAAEDGYQDGVPLAPRVSQWVQNRDVTTKLSRQGRGTKAPRAGKPGLWKTRKIMVTDAGHDDRSGYIMAHSVLGGDEGSQLKKKNSPTVNFNNFRIQSLRDEIAKFDWMTAGARYYIVFEWKGVEFLVRSNDELGHLMKMCDQVKQLAAVKLYFGTHTAPQELREREWPSSADSGDED